MHTYTDSRKQALVNQAQAAIDKAQAIIDDMCSQLQPRPVNTVSYTWVRISDMTPEEQAKIIRMTHKAR